jgi:hypothetical protein
MWRSFIRTWGRNNPAYPGGLEPYVGRRSCIRYHDTEEDARIRCSMYNSRHKPGRLSRKAEYESFNAADMRRR